MLVLASCTCGKPLKVTSIQGDDKKLACKDVILEINEAEHYREQASKEKGINFGEALMPVCWVSGYIDGAQAVKAANARIDYLGRIYDLLDCGGLENGGDSSSVPPPPPAVVLPSSPRPGVAPFAANPYSAPQAQFSSHYRNIDKNSGLHEHRDRNGKIYVHSHSHSGPHRHFEDQ